MNRPSSRLCATHMKMFFLSTRASFAMICSCQRQDSAADAATCSAKERVGRARDSLERKRERLDARERALAESSRYGAEMVKLWLSTTSRSTTCCSTSSSKSTKKGEELQATVAQQQKGMEALTAQVEKVSAQVQVNKPAPQLTANNE